ncbi:Meiotic coiled-coil protein [Sparassis crispa]|uniref:Meiotic nuclear division protein 1 n=1 Tax=Sparassis crispa TaxID=139825 RepID=A0A401GGF0_9APHY|nr:Meiotic coiled-coil protein [Sparassis crispa]GBE81183.1 Meiotic coiled-coil protein [Sparassis crispa]
MAPRGLSAEEKRVKLLEIFHETVNTIGYQLKELEKLGPKMKGIVSQSVKEVLQGLVDDGLVQAEKIGSSNFFWSFPSQRGAMMQNRLNTVKESQAAQRAQLAEIRAAIEAEKAARPDSVRLFSLFSDVAERNAALTKLAVANNELAALESELAAYGACDPAKVEEKKRAVTLAKEAAVRWTGERRFGARNRAMLTCFNGDNYILLLSYFTRQSCVEPAEIKKYLGVDDEYEDIC